MPPLTRVPLRFRARRLLHAALWSLGTAAICGMWNLDFVHGRESATVSLFLGRLVPYFVLFFVGALFVLRWRESKWSERQVVKGTRLLLPEVFNATFSGTGLGIPVLLPSTLSSRLFRRPCSKGILRMRGEDERYHLTIFGDSGTGKSAIIHSFLKQIERRDSETAIVYDPSLEFWEHWGEPRSGDVLLFPLAEECPYWDIADEIENDVDAIALAKSIIPGSADEKNQFWTVASQTILGFLLMEMKQQEVGVQGLIDWLSNTEKIDQMVEGTPLASIIPPDAAPQRAGVLGHMNALATSLKLLPPLDGRPRFSFRAWARERRGNVFVGTRGPRDRYALRPVISAWLDTACHTLMMHRQAPPSWYFVDELPSLQRLPSLSKAVVEGRKYNLRCVLGFQGRAQLEALYGKETETMMSTPRVKIVLRTSDFSAATGCARLIGEPEQEQATQSFTSSATDGERDSVSVRIEKKTHFLVGPNEIQNLENMHGYLRYHGYVTPIRFEYPEVEQRNVVKLRTLPPLYAKALEAEKTPPVLRLVHPRR